MIPPKLTTVADVPLCKCESGNHEMSFPTGTWSRGRKLALLVQPSSYYSVYGIHDVKDQRVWFHQISYPPLQLQSVFFPVFLTSKKVSSFEDSI